MTETLPDAGADHNLPIFTVSEISQALKAVVEETFSWVRVRGEISGFKRAASGHLYLSLKDAESVMDAVCWKGTAGRLGLSPEDGIEVIATGRLTTYPGRSKYQLVIEGLEMAGEGALLKLLEDRKRRLAAEGLFDPARKRPIPFLPDVIGVVTSPTGAVIRDILHRLADRFPRRVLVWPVRVQGDGAAAEIAAAIAGFNGLPEVGPAPRPGLIIVARGGGGLEDLWAFNEEIVARAAAASTIPLISAVGHETDFTLIDFVSDLRAPTPTAAAEMAVPVRLELMAQVADDGTRLIGALGRLLVDRRQRLDGLARGLPNLRRVVESASQRLDDWAERLGNSLRTGIDRRRARLDHVTARIPSPRREIVVAAQRIARESQALQRSADGLFRERQVRLAHAAALLESFSYTRVLDRGFALVLAGDGRPVSSVTSLSAGMDLTLRLRDGTAGVTVGKTPGTPPPGGGRTAAKGGRSPAKDDRQRKLL
ncbi:MAG: exodeoxyribonuclease VII large subunit [Rhodospirillales bacterium]|nr:exodeoxyribonuclease VII large subunit [Rhodospirillales bacterium]